MTMLNLIGEVNIIITEKFQHRRSSTSGQRVQVLDIMISMILNIFGQIRGSGDFGHNPENTVCSNWNHKCATGLLVEMRIFDASMFLPVVLNNSCTQLYQLTIANVPEICLCAVIIPSFCNFFLLRALPKKERKKAVQSIFVYTSIVVLSVKSN